MKQHCTKCPHNPWKENRMLSFMSDTFSWCVSEAWAYLSCVFLCRERFSLLPPSLSNCSLFQSSQPDSSLSFWVDLTMFLRENWQKKDLSLFPRKIFDASLLNNSTFHWSWSCTGDAFSRLCLISWICPEWCSCCVPIFYTSLIPWDDMSAWLESAKRTLMQTENITSESTRWG